MYSEFVFIIERPAWRALHWLFIIVWPAFFDMFDACQRYVPGVYTLAAYGLGVDMPGVLPWQPAFFYMFDACQRYVPGIYTLAAYGLGV